VVVETATFALAPGVADDDFLVADRAVQTELVPTRHGFVRRTTARRDGRWLVVTLWATDEDAEDFERASGGDPVRARFESLIDLDTLERARYDTLD